MKKRSATTKHSPRSCLNPAQDQRVRFEQKFGHILLHFFCVQVIEYSGARLMISALFFVTLLIFNQVFTQSHLSRCINFYKDKHIKIWGVSNEK